MKPRKLAVLIGSVVIVAVAVFLLVINKPKPVIQKQAVTDSTKALVTNTPKETSSSPSATPTSTPTPSSKYSPLVRAKIRAEFIDNCNTRGHYGIPACTCVADYLATNYSETELAQIYIQYHISNQVPSQVRTAISTCSKK